MKLAQEYAQKAYDANNSMPEALYNLAVLLEHNARESEAVFYYDKLKRI